MPSERVDNLGKIAKHIATLNDELGRLDKLYETLKKGYEGMKSDVILIKVDTSLMKSDIGWIKKIGYVIATALTVCVIKILFVT